MTTAQTANRLVRDTTMCGDPKIWFPMRVTYSREMKVKGELERLEIENFVPMKYQFTELRNDGESELRRVLVPAINNLIFVHSTQERISELKASNEQLEPLRYMMDLTTGDDPVIMTVSDRAAITENEFHGTRVKDMQVDGKNAVLKRNKTSKNCNNNDGSVIESIVFCAEEVLYVGGCG